MKLNDQDRHDIIWALREKAKADQKRAYELVGIGQYETGVSFEKRAIRLEGLADTFEQEA
jgi:hypothetical protein